MSRDTVVIDGEKTPSCHNIEIVIEDESWDGFADIEEFCEAVISRALQYCKIEECEVAVLLTGDNNMKELNHQFRGKDKSTNVLTFTDEGASCLTGDIALAWGTVEREARERGKKIEHHLAHLLVHATLHMLGHDHEQDDEAEDMESKEIEILKSFNISNPYI